jgi:A/G-specific adenine glycosylase
VARKKRPVRVAMLAAVVSTTGAKTRRVLLARRARDGLFGGLWEPPMVETPSLGDGLLGLRALGIGLELRAAGSVTHVLSHRELVVSVMTGTASRVFAMKIATDGVYEEAAWIAVEQGDLGMSTLARKLLKRAL